MDINWTEIFVALIGFLGAIITGVLIPYIRTKTTATQRENIYTIVFNAVKAAEQILKKEDPTGEKRKQYVINYLSSKGINLTIEDLNILIEAAVKELNIIQEKIPPGKALG